ncbi:MAG: PEGA domain-containing protein [Planctomycetota bacterium]
MDDHDSINRGRFKRAMVAATLVLLASGCVERRMTVRSNPTNALVILDGQEIGHTPVSTSFTYYGDREIKLVKDGYETKTIKQTVSTPWYQYPPLDFISEALIPWRIRDERNYVYTLEPAMAVSDADLLQRAAQVRVEGQNPPARVLERAGLPARATDNP